MVPKRGIKSPNMSAAIQETSDIETEIEAELEEGEQNEEVQVKASKNKNKSKKTPVVKKDGIVKTSKKNSVPRALPRPYKNLTMERLTTTIDTLKERVEVTDNRLQTYSIRLRKLNSEMDARTKEAL
jgi:hypothetical protein